jgi:truncated hemoglobin YjbI
VPPKLVEKTVYAFATQAISVFELDRCASARRRWQARRCAPGARSTTRHGWVTHLVTTRKGVKHNHPAKAELMATFWAAERGASS